MSVAMQGNKKEISCLKFQFGDECKYLLNLHCIAYPREPLWLLMSLA